MPNNAPPAMRNRILLLSAGLLAIGCGEKNTFAPPPPAKVTVQAPLVQDQQVYSEFSGRIEAAQVLEVRARVRGFLEKIAFEPGKLIEEGATLFEIEDTPYVAAQKAAEADIAKTEAAEGIAQIGVDRRKNVGSGVSEIEKEAAVANLAAAQADVLAAKAALVKADNDLSYTIIKAEMSGRISESHVDLGNLVGNNEATLLTTIVKDDEMRVYFEVNERQALEFLRKRKAGVERKRQTEFRLILADGSEYEHKAIPEFADNRIDQETGTLLIRSMAPNPDGKLADGLFVRVGVPSIYKQAVMVPTTALQQDLAGDYLMTVGEGNKVLRRPVELGPRVTVEGRQMRVIAGGLEATEKVIVIGLQRAREGAVVAPTEAPATPTPAAPNPPAPAEPSTEGTDAAE
jgi:RND family efflux transporter MFP subunit